VYQEFRTNKFSCILNTPFSLLSLVLKLVAEFLTGMDIPSFKYGSQHIDPHSESMFFLKPCLNSLGASAEYLGSARAFSSCGSTWFFEYTCIQTNARNMQMLCKRPSDNDKTFSFSRVSTRMIIQWNEQV